MKTTEDSKRAEPAPEACLAFVWSVVVCKLVEGLKPTHFPCTKEAMLSAVFTLMLLSFAVFHLCSISLKDLNDKFSIFEKKTRNVKCLA